MMVMPFLLYYNNDAGLNLLALGFDTLLLS